MSALTGALVAVHLPTRRGARAHPAGWLFIPFLAYAAANAAWVTPVALARLDRLAQLGPGRGVFWVV
jgi:hypothetical protein